MGLRILLAVDDSPFSRSAARVALGIAAAIDDAEITALHVVNVVTASGNLFKDLPGRLGFEPAVVSPEIEEQHDEAGRAVLAAVKEQAESRGVEVRTVLEHGAVVERLVHWADKADLLIMGIRGETEARFPGQGGASVHTVLERTSIPAMLVPDGIDEIRAVALGYDGSEAARHTLDMVQRMVGRLSIPVHAIYVSSDGSGGGVLAQVDAALPGVQVTHHVVQGEAVHQALAETSMQVGANVLALGFHGHSRFKDFVFGSVTEFIVEKSELIVLVAH